MNRRQRRAQHSKRKTLIRKAKSQAEIAELEASVNLELIAKGVPGDFECPDCKVAVIEGRRALVPPETLLRDLYGKRIDEVRDATYQQVMFAPSAHVLQWFKDNPERNVYFRPAVRDGAKYLSDDHLLKLVEEGELLGYVPYTLVMRNEGQLVQAIVMIEPIPQHRIDAMSDDEFVKMFNGKVTQWNLSSNAPSCTSIPVFSPVHSLSP